MGSHDRMRADVAIFYATVVLMANVQIVAVKGDPQVPCFFIFGDSLSDNGNNNFQLTIAKANYRPYGIDFPGGNPTGRFNNGPTIVDYIAQLLGFSEFIAPFATATSRDVILKGVNYASGGSGIRDETGMRSGFVLSMNKQLRNHNLTCSRIANFLHSPQASKDYLKKCIFHVGMGNNDYLNNYFLPGSSTSRDFTPEQYAQVLIDQYRGQLKRLYDLGARKVALAGNGLIGCTPYAISTFGTNGSLCVDKLNNASQLFNDKVVSLVDQFNSNFSDAKFIYINSVGIGSGDPNSAGFTVLNKPCCRVGLTGQCLRFSTPCQNRNTHVFWDNYHPTTAVNNLTAIRSYTALLGSDTYPIDIKLLAQLQL